MTLIVRDPGCHEATDEDDCATFWYFCRAHDRAYQHEACGDGAHLALESITALGRMGLPEDVADVVGFLAGPRGRWISGQTIDVSGGTYLGPLMPG